MIHRFLRASPLFAAILLDSQVASHTVSMKSTNFLTLVHVLHSIAYTQHMNGCMCTAYVKPMAKQNILFVITFMKHASGLSSICISFIKIKNLPQILLSIPKWILLCFHSSSFSFIIIVFCEISLVYQLCNPINLCLVFESGRWKCLLSAALLSVSYSSSSWSMLKFKQKFDCLLPQTAAALLVSQMLHNGVSLEMPTADLLDAVHSAFNDLEQVHHSAYDLWPHVMALHRYSNNAYMNLIETSVTFTEMLQLPPPKKKKKKKSIIFIDLRHAVSACNQ